ncbi:NADH:ubiquinone oxidoreductase, subunit I [Candidatus Kuenenia stuttgartiensis]|jgi:NADH-quinone oxidoreductase subunit I|uniref:NADH-quinone oxidoreductase subunit I n=1 Tax=Kuenenia stuttgartiensis TaxID=174633 RepID=Q1PWH7_KUEST|nr:MULTISPECIES: NADH-quinone oxidoreductase subunit I [Kuenenia]MBE7545889.1 NADH-quinone oxidoreductase subunit I [Planctomycetia bacterium]MBW7942888.1 NADH-quinone oxidoreductase subunit I [Candidatus Kuenenia stuttgartiensis]MBZ0193319.1 NADH-quinone oxidoreductase subunit I [Candidatus Kuenenia stuttgartiensis]MCF6152201.1 NADH-quinone oxidoreductase subunit I [Candidatus Kuenenia stuttgartiensis]MCL4727354.1 NADH-quinone oxidoreductase subunit I [Candidatus Kuenenia stuttgartiensis]
MILPLVKGLLLTLKRFLNPFTCVTESYPDARPRLAKRFRGLPELQIGEDGREKCVACGLCAKVCPSQCISIEGAEDEQFRRYPSMYELDSFRCIFCGFCEEACPERAILLGDVFELATDKNSGVLDKEKLLESARKRKL